MSKTRLYLRFGVHKDKQVLYKNNDLYAGLVIPANILVYFVKAIKATVLYINRPYFIDPMTYILSEQGIEGYVSLDNKNSKRHFKPSIAKLVDLYGLSDLFVKRDFKPLIASDFTTSFIENLVKNNINIQLNMLENESLIKKYLKILQKAGEQDLTVSTTNQKPMFITTPYFFFDSLSSPWLDITLKIAQKTKEIQPDYQIAPVILTNTDCLTPELLNKFSDFSNIILWISDFNEKTIRNNHNDDFLKQLTKVIDFISLSFKRKVNVYNLYGGYFSIILTKYGLKGLSNGIFYGEHKSRLSSVGGVPPSRYYIRKIHEFFTIPEALSLLSDNKYKSLLDIECEPAMKMIGGDFNEIFAFDMNPSLAQKHFLISRECEFKEIEEMNISEIAKELKENFDKYSPLPATITKKRIDYLESWSNALVEKKLLV